MRYLGRPHLCLVVLTLLISALSVHARRGGGGDGGSSGGGGGDGSSGGGGGGDDDGLSPEERMRDEACRKEVGQISPSWLHRWIGTYYNGTIETSIEIEPCNGTCTKKNSTLDWKSTGVLSLLDPLYDDSGNSRPLIPRPKNPFVALLYGWPNDTSQSELLARRGDSFLAPPVDLALETVTQFSYSEITYGLDPSSLVSNNNPTCRVQKVVEADGGYEFECSYDGLGVYRATDSSQFIAPMANSSGSTPMVVEPANNTMLSGKFSPQSAEFVWKGPFVGFFAALIGQSSLKKDYLYQREFLSDGSRYTGNFEVRFQGKVDARHSHEMVVKSGKM